MDSAVSAIITALEAHNVSPQIITFLISMIPLLELRGSIIVAGSILKLPFFQTFITAVLGNMLPIPFILLFIKKIFGWMKGVKGLKKFPDWVEASAMKRSEQIEKYGYLGLFLFVAIPLPGTGAWTGSLLAVLFGMNPKKSLLFIFMGVCFAGIIMSLVSFGAINGIVNLFG
ncbi:MAG: small multi-drug export protein [Oscillospiraceae bacterium]|nr:small multi-drug export protein [Oscillospiraceae bacterium]